MKGVIQKDCTKDFLNFLKEENERARKHELEMMKMIMAPYYTSSSGRLSFQQYSVCKCLH